MKSPAAGLLLISLFVCAAAHPAAWTIKVTNGANLSGTPVASLSSYSRAGNIVNFSFLVTGTTSVSAATPTSLTFVLPAVPDVALISPGWGVVLAGGVPDHISAVLLHGNKTTTLHWTSTSAEASNIIVVSGSYQAV